VRWNQTNDVSEILDGGGVSADFREPHNGNTLLHIACQNGHKELIQMLVIRGADVNAQNHHGQTALHFAYTYSFVEIGEWLRKMGADDGLLNESGLCCYEGLG